MATETLDLGLVTVTIRGPAASIWQKGGKARLYFSTDQMRHIDLDRLASDPKATAPTNITGFKADATLAAGLYRVVYTGSNAGTRSTTVIVEQRGN